MQILRFPSINSTQFLGASNAFWDTLTAAMHRTMVNLQRLEGRPKGAAFAYEMEMDKARYAALIVLERWGEFVHAFGPHVQLDTRQGIIDQAPARVQTAENLLQRTNRLVDAAEFYSTELLAACEMAFNAVRGTFEQERNASEQMILLGPMLPEEYEEARRLFTSDLSVR